MKQIVFFFSCLVIGIGNVGNIVDAQGTRLLRDPDVSAEKIVFVHANDIWTVDRDGGQALRLTSGEGGETDPVFSADGKPVSYTHLTLPTICSV